MGEQLVLGLWMSAAGIYRRPSGLREMGRSECAPRPTGAETNEGKGSYDDVVIAVALSNCAAGKAGGRSR